jgi:hypothetical protein
MQYQAELVTYRVSSYSISYCIQQGVLHAIKHNRSKPGHIVLSEGFQHLIDLTAPYERGEGIWHAALNFSLGLRYPILRKVPSFTAGI